MWAYQSGEEDNKGGGGDGTGGEKMGVRVENIEVLVALFINSTFPNLPQRSNII